MRFFPRMTPRCVQLKNEDRDAGSPAVPYLPKPQKNQKEKEKRLSRNRSSGEFFSERGSMAVEAALVFPLFLGICALFFTFFGGQLLSLSLQKALDAVCEDVAVWSYAVDFAEDYTGTDLMSLAEGSHLSGALNGNGEELLDFLSGKLDIVEEIQVFLKEQTAALFWQTMLKWWLIGKVGKPRLDQFALLDGGAEGLSLSGSTLRNRELDLVLTYRIRSPLPFPFSLHYDVVQRSCRRLWTGTPTTLPKETDPAAEEESGEEEKEEDVVYMTVCGTVYHTDKNCRSLAIKVGAYSLSAVPSLRNENGGKYYPCERCTLRSGVTEGIVYLTESGVRYHIDRDCPSLKRTLIEIAKSEAEASYRACRFCGGSP